MELWKPVVGFEGRYEVSNLGRVRGMFKGRGTAFKQGRILKTPASGGYPHLNLRKDGKTITRKVHALMAEAFLGSVPTGYEVRHLDDIPTNNVLSNLAIGTMAENQQDRKRNGGGNAGEKHGMSKLNESQVREIRLRREPFSALAKKFGVSTATVSNIITGKRWKHGL